MERVGAFASLADSAIEVCLLACLCASLVRLFIVCVVAGVEKSSG